MTEITETRSTAITWEHSETFGELAAALAKAQGEFSPVEKQAENPFFKSKYADLASIVKAASPITAKNGLAVTQLVGRNDDGKTTLRTVLMHASGEWISSEMVLFLAKADPQAQGSAITYARRYAYSALLGIVTDEDDDGNAAQPKAPAPSTRREAPRQRPQAPAESSDPNMISTKQINMLRAVLAKDHEITDNADIHAVVGGWIGREVASLKDLTKREASTAIDAATGKAPAEPARTGSESDYNDDPF